MNTENSKKVMSIKMINPDRKGFSGIIKLWLPKYIVKDIRVNVERK